MLSATRIRTYLGLAKDGWELSHAKTDEAQRRARRHLIERMGQLRSLPQKLGQIIGFSNGDVESTEEDYSVLQEDAEPLSLETVQPILEAEWGQPMKRVVRDISADAKAASLGQVHRAMLHDGREVAVKIQYPGIRDAVFLDLKLLGWLSIPLGNLHRGFDLPGYRDAILDDLERELDYCQEAEFQRTFFNWAIKDPFLAVPEIIDELSTNKVLVSRWEEGDHWRDVQRSWSAQEKQQLGVRLIEFFHEGLFQRGLVHADWHPGNLRFRRSAGGVQLLLYDFGCVYRPTDDHRLALLRLIRAACRQDEPPYPLFLKLDFRSEFLDTMARKLPAICRVLFEPYAAEYSYDLRDWRLGERFGDILGEDRWNFRIAGPPELIFLLRAFHGLHYYAQGLAVRTAWNQVIEPLFAHLSDDMNCLELPQSSHGPDGFEGLARQLRIRVTEHGRTRVQITHRAAAIDNLEELIDGELTARIERQGVKLDELVADVRRRCYAPGEVFRLVEGEKEIVVWLE